ncbi:MAG TPA: hypothetical protein VIM59_03905 [Cellvibrio sp.]
MIVDIFEFNGEKIEIHVINLIDHDYFSIYALDSKGDKVHGTEIRISKPFRIELIEFALQQHTTSIVSFLRNQIESLGLEPWNHATIDANFQKMEVVDDLRAAGRKAFLAGRHYRINPFININPFRHDEWQRGWMEESEKDPGRFNFDTEMFNSAKP